MQKINAKTSELLMSPWPLCPSVCHQFQFFFVTDGECESVGWRMIENLQTSVTSVWRWLRHSHHSGINCSCLLFAAAPVQRLTWMTRGSAERIWSGGVRSPSPAFCLSRTFTKPKRSHSCTAIGSVPGLVKEDVAWLWVFGNVRCQPVELFYRLGIYFLHIKKEISNKTLLMSMVRHRRQAQDKIVELKSANLQTDINTRICSIRLASWKYSGSTRNPKRLAACTLWKIHFQL